MLKISFSETPGEEKWILAGRLSGAWVRELRASWKKHHQADKKRACIVDLNEVTFVDKAGERLKITFGAEGYNLLNHPNFAVPSNMQSPQTLGGNGDAIYKDAAGHLANNVGRIFTTVGTGRQIQLDARFTF